MCGHDDLTDYPYLFFSAPHNDVLLTRGKCVSECPISTSTASDLCSGCSVSC
jgi:hypothetical protein